MSLSIIKVHNKTTCQGYHEIKVSLSIIKVHNKTTCQIYLDIKVSTIQAMTDLQLLIQSIFVFTLIRGQQGPAWGKMFVKFSV